jgi:hypothetical protein
MSRLNVAHELFVDKIKTMDDKINPDHYKGKVQPIDLFESNDSLEPFCSANIIKYVFRYKKKNGLEDLKKAQFYLNKLIELNTIKDA